MNTRVLSSKVCSNLKTYIYIPSKPYFTTSVPLFRNQPSAARMIPAKSRKRKPSSPPTFLKMASQRIVVLEAAIAAIDSRSDMKPKKLKKLNEHLAEKAELERQVTQDRDGIPDGEGLQNTSSIYVESGGEKASLGTIASPKDSTSQNTMLQKLRPRPSRVQEPPGVQQSPRSRPTSQPGTPKQLGVQEQAPDTRVSGKDNWRSPGAPRVRDPIVPPSSASGGVPEPSPAYYQRSSLPPQPASQPQHILLVIDLNGTILHRPDRKRPTDFVARQSTQLFLDYVFSRFQVMIWSSARPENVKLMCNKLFPGQARQNLVAEWGRNRMGLTQEDYNKRVQVYKRLEKIWADPGIQSRHPLGQAGWIWDQSNTILIDDSLEKARSEPFNLVELPEFVGRPEPSDVLRQLAEYLDDLLMQKDVSAYIRQTPFKPTP